MHSPPPTWRGQSSSRSQTIAIGKVVGQHCRAGDLIALIGELGAGKTQFTQGLAAGLGIDAAVASPTFVMAQEYTREQSGKEQAPLRLIHIDAYRIHKLDELESIGWEITGDTLGGEMRRGSVVAIEWADRLDELVGSDRLEVKLAHVGDDQRNVQIMAHGNWAGRSKELFDALRAVLPNPIQASATATPNPEPPTPNPIPCPICKKPVLKTDATFPFCSKRCKTIDLGKWLSGNYVISRPVEQNDLEEES